MDVSSVTAVSAAPAQSAAAPVTIDAIFGALLQSVTDAENAALATPSLQGAALALVMPANTPAGQQTGIQQDNTTVAPGPQAPWLSAPIVPTTPVTPTAQSAMSEPLPDFPAPATNGQQNADSQTEQGAPALPDTAAQTVLISAPTKDKDIVLPVATDAPAPEPASSASQQPVSAAPRQQPPTELPLPAAIAPEPVPATTTSQSASAQTSSPQTVPSEQQVPTPPSSALDVADQIVATPAPSDPAPVTVKPTTSKTKVAAEPQIAKSDDTATPNAIADVLAGFLLPQIEPMAAPANDTTADTVDPIASAKSDDQNSAPTTDQNAAAPAQPVPVAVVQSPPTSVPNIASVQPDEQPARAAIGQVPATKTDAPADEPATPAVAQKPATRQQASHQTASERSQPVFVPANDTAPDSKPEVQAPTDTRGASAAADTRTAAATDTPQPAQASAPTPAPHQAAAAIANPLVPPAAPSGLRKLTAGLQVAMQEQETVSSIDKLSLTIATKSIDGLRHFDIRLDPPELGRVQVQLTTDDAGRSQANVIVDKPQTLELLQRDAQNLNRALTDAGLDVSNNGLNFSLREQYRQNDGGADQGRNRSLSVQAVMQTDATQIHSSLGSYAPNSVRLDIRV